MIYIDILSKYFFTCYNHKDVFLYKLQVALFVPKGTTLCILLAH